MKQTPKARRKFDNTFKREAVQNWLSSGKSADAIADELGLSANLLYTWKKLFAPDAVGGNTLSTKPGSTADLQSQLDAPVANWHPSGSSATFLKERWLYSPTRPPAV